MFLEIYCDEKHAIFESLVHNKVYLWFKNKKENVQTLSHKANTVELINLFINYTCTFFCKNNYVLKNIKTTNITNKD